MYYDVNLNIHYSVPEEVWAKIDNVYRNMPYWAELKGCPHWVGTGIDVSASVEPGGIQISGEMPENIWNEWYSTLKTKLTEVLGYEVGEPENGYEFKYWTPFEKKYLDIKSVEKQKIVFNDYSMFFWNQFEERKRDISAKPPYFVFKSPYIELKVVFDESSKKINKKNFVDFQKQLENVGIRTLDLS